MFITKKSWHLLPKNQDVHYQKIMAFTTEKP